MFSFIRWIYRRIYITILFIMQTLSELMETPESDERSSWLNECEPLRTNEQLIEYFENPFSWNSLVEPLAPRCTPRQYGDHYQTILGTEGDSTEFLNEKCRPKVLVCHDLAGNYRVDRFINGTNKFDDYRFHHWAGIDIFNYFSHQYITIPPLPWINACHRNGVPIIGTIIVEFDAGKKILDQLLRSKQDINRYIEAIVLVTKNFGFDGWLLNIECRTDPEQIPLLKEFTSKLSNRIHEEIRNGIVIWYDSVIETGNLEWQNEVNSRNIGMYKGTDGILLNYCWNHSHLQRTVNILQQNQVEMAKVYVGIDVFGRGQIAGFNTYNTLRQIVDSKLSIGFFAPAWTFECVPDELPLNGDGTDEVLQKFLDRNTRFWTLLWRYFYTKGPVKLPFYTSFCMGSGKMKFRNGIRIASQPWFNLMEQQYQPSVPSLYEYQFDEAYHGGSCIKINAVVRNIRLFATDFPCKHNLIVSFVFKRSDSHIEIQLVLNAQNEDGDKNLLIYCESEERNRPTVAMTSYERFISPLKTTLLKYTVIGLSNRHEKIFPTSNRPINGWETRYYYLNFDDVAKFGRIVDIGISVNKRNWNENDSVLLGALHVHGGIEEERYITEHLETVSFDENQAVAIDETL